MKKFSDAIPHGERRYVIKTNAGDEFLEKIESAQWEAAKLNFYWTRARAEAAVFTGIELSKTFYKVVSAFSGPRLERVA